VSATGSAVRITSTGDVTTTSIDAPIVAASGAGDMTLGNVASSTTALVQIETGSGDDSVTLNAVADKFLVDMGAGDDSVIANSAAGSVINLGLGDDTLTATAGAAGFFGSAVGGGGTDTVVLSNNGNYSTNGVWTEIEKIQLGGNVTLSEAQLDNDTTFQITGSNGVITATGVVSTNLSDVSFQSGNTSTFNITGHATLNSSLTGSDAADTLTGVAGADTLTGGLGDDILDGAAGNDVITGGAGADTITGGNGVDTLTGGTGVDKFVLATASANRDTITDFTAGGGGDQLQISAAQTTLTTTVNTAPVTTDDTTTAGAGGGSYAMTGATSANADVVILQSGTALTTGANGGDLSAATDGTELLKALTDNTAADTYTGITVGTAADSFYAVAYQGGKAYVYLITESTGDTLAAAAEIELIATLNTITADTIVQGNLDLIP
jgi:Ca2+-binding RTX toxin-like protein